MKSIYLLTALTALSTSALDAKKKPNIVVLLADDISAREFPVYNSDTWTKPGGGDTQDPKFRAKTPVMERIAEQGVLISTCWAATVSSPTRGQLMTGRYAYQTKWWHNGDQGRYKNAKGEQETWSLYMSSPRMMAKVTQEAGYKTCWAGKTQMSHTDTNIGDYGFDEGLYTPGDLSNSSPYTDFVMQNIGKKKFKIKDSGLTTDTYLQTSYFWFPSVMAVNTPENTKRNKMEPWPLSNKDKKEYGLTSFAQDIEQDYIFDFMNRSIKDDKPFFIYHTSHLGHDQYNFLDPNSTAHWVSTPKVSWDGKKYTRTTPKITGDKGVYNTHNSITEPGIHSHISYLDYSIWRYLEEFKRLGIEDNTIFIITADNATSRYGKGNATSQRGTHVPFMIYAPCLNMTKKGKQEVLMNIADIYPTIAEIVGVDTPSDYKIDGESMLSFLTSDKKTHRDWIYSYKSDQQMIRGDKVLRDGDGKWYDVESYPSDLISFKVIKDWSKVSAAHNAERIKLEAILPTFDLWEAEHDGPGGIYKPSNKTPKNKKPKKKQHNISTKITR